MNVYSIYDSKAEAYLQPFFEKTDGTARRAFSQAANDPQHNFHKFAADYTLFRIGCWDEATGTLEMQTHQNLGTALTYIEDSKHLVAVK